MTQPFDKIALADQIMAYTSVDANPKDPAPGERMTLETVPGILPFAPADLTGAANFPALGPAGLTMNSLIKVIKFTVKYKVLVNGAEYSKLSLEPLTPATLPDSDPLKALLRVCPPLVPEHSGNTPLKVELAAVISVEVEGHRVQKEVKFPLDIPAIPVPSMLVLTGNSKVFVMVRPGSKITDVTLAANQVNSTVQALNNVKDLLSWGPVFDLFLGDLGDILAMLSSGGAAGVAVEQALDLDDFNDFDDEADQMGLIGPAGTEVRFYSGEEFNELAAGDDEVTRIRLDTDIGAGTPTPVVTGFGFARESGWQTSRMWDTDSEDEMDDVESCRYVNPGDPNSHPGEDDLPPL
ncbi:hypothetical protein OG889_44915 [Streptomyces sp. NBC_00481]|uniref:hypothetical protein n=1 Tax=Streptomyces sp. NBC_00481 TaxID=2975755 RepID=UPI002DDA8B6F|nr:hypothetical protein [Streptomyces sp. NBC_00481]WRZ01197.1 hypothetical protein OG889_44915 [Streptomyces sp. NBC_00481]